MRQTARKLRIGIAVVAALAGAAAFGIYATSQARLDKTYDLAAALPAIAGDPQQVARGLHLARTRGCADCHTGDFGGKIFFDEPGVKRHLPLRISATSRFTHLGQG